jgi:hypothetical protein
MRLNADLTDPEAQALVTLDLVDLNAIAERLDVNYGTVAQWRHRGQFIAPDLEPSIGPLWVWRRVRTWSLASGKGTIAEVTT